MKRRTQLILLLLLLAVFCLCVFAGCTREKADFFTYSEENLGLVGKLVKWMHGWIGNYGWTVVVFTVFLKLIMLPLDVWQRVSSRKSSLKMQKLQPLMQEIDRRYGANTQRANIEKNKLTKEQGLSMYTMCLPMIITMVVFFVMFGGLRNYSTYSSITNFQNLTEVYISSYYDAITDPDELSFITTQYTKLYNEDTEATTEKARTTNARLKAIDAFQSEENYGFDHCQKYRDAALEKVGEYYEENHESWLWIQNIWQPDTWATIMPEFRDRYNGFSNDVLMEEFGSGNPEGFYNNIIRPAVLEKGGYGENGTWNGLMILPILSIGLSFLSMFLTQLMDKKARSGETPQPQDAQQAASNKFMMFLMPAMMAMFGFMYTGAFAIYMVCNYALGIISTVLMKAPVERIVEKSLQKEEAKNSSGKASYMR